MGVMEQLLMLKQHLKISVSNKCIWILTPCLRVKRETSNTHRASLSLYSHTLMQQSKTNCCPLSLQSPLLQPVNGGINMFEWRESLSFVGVEGPVISCLGSQEAAASIQLCEWVCVCISMSACEMHACERRPPRRGSWAETDKAFLRLSSSISSPCWWFTHLALDVPAL